MTPPERSLSSSSSMSSPDPFKTLENSTANNTVYIRSSPPPSGNDSARWKHRPLRDIFSPLHIEQLFELPQNSTEKPKNTGVDLYSFKECIVICSIVIHIRMSNNNIW
jgi:hypothetical protein